MKCLLIIIAILWCCTNAHAQTPPLSCIQSGLPFSSGKVSLSDELVEHTLISGILESNYTIEFRLYTVSSFPNLVTITVISSSLDSAFITSYDFVNSRRSPGKGWLSVRATSVKDTVFEKTTTRNISDKFCTLFLFFVQHGLFTMPEKGAPANTYETDPGSTWIEIKYYDKFRQVIYSGSSDKRSLALDEIIRHFRRQ